MLIDGFGSLEPGVNPDDVYVVALSPTPKLAYIPSQIDLLNSDSSLLATKLKRFVSAAIGDVDVVVIKRGGFLAATKLLAEIKIIAPVFREDLVNYLRKETPDLPEEWVFNQLDNLRKNGLLVRMKNKRYALTSQGLMFSGTRKDRNSSDVRRVLELSKRVG